MPALVRGPPSGDRHCGGLRRRRQPIDRNWRALEMALGRVPAGRIVVAGPTRGQRVSLEHHLPPDQGNRTLSFAGQQVIRNRDFNPCAVSQR